MVKMKRESQPGLESWWRLASSDKRLKDLRMSQGSSARKTLRAALPRFSTGGLLSGRGECAGWQPVHRPGRYRRTFERDGNALVESYYETGLGIWASTKRMSAQIKRLLEVVR